MLRILEPALNTKSWTGLRIRTLVKKYIGQVKVRMFDSRLLDKIRRACVSVAQLGTSEFVSSSKVRDQLLDFITSQHFNTRVH
jgi:hypothetical protein